MSQTLCLPKSKVEIILNICYLNLAPSMVIILCVHSLHLTKMVIRLSIRGKFILAVMEAFKIKEREDETQFTTNIDGFLYFIPC